MRIAIADLEPVDRIPEGIEAKVALELGFGAVRILLALAETIYIDVILRIGQVDVLEVMLGPPFGSFVSLKMTSNCGCCEKRIQWKILFESLFERW